MKNYIKKKKKKKENSIECHLKKLKTKKKNKLIIFEYARALHHIINKEIDRKTYLIIEMTYLSS